jgi:rhodanese-related sulfurtransferase
VTTYREHLARTKAEIEEIGSPALAEALESDAPPLVIDVREQSEWDEGHIPTAVHIPRGHLESRIERVARDHEAPIVLTCASGIRSAFAAKTLEELGYRHVSSHESSTRPRGSVSRRCARRRRRSRR